MSLTQLRIGQLGPHGDGIHAGSRGKVYVERSLPGDRVMAKLQRDPQGIVRGDIIELIEPSRFRQDPPCRHFAQCGNCTLQHVQDRFYREWKVGTVREALLRYGIRPTEWLPTVFSGEANRRRATFVAQRGREGLTVGYFQRRSQRAVPIDECRVAHPSLLEVKNRLLPYLKRWLPERTTVNLFVQWVDGGADVVVTGELPPRSRGELQQLTPSILKETPVRRLSVRSGENETPRILGGEPCEIQFGKLRVKLPPGAFLQPTEEGEQALVDAVLEAAPSEGRFADLFSGCGTFSGRLLERGPVDAYEMTQSAVSALAKSAKEQPLRAFRRDLFRHPLKRSELNRYDLVIFDPPRGGSPEQAEELADSKCGVIVGVSCNPATFARDAAILSEGGFRLSSLKVVDQFRWSHHVEIVGTFSRKRKNRSG